MNATAVLLIVALLTLVVEHQVHADFFYNRVIPKPEEISNLDLKCVPGRTIMKIQEKAPEINNEGSSSEDEENMFKDRRRKHMTAQTNDDYCKVCVCSVSGKDEYCSRRPARNVNECLRMATLMQTFKENIPFEHERSLSFRIRRDYLWHDDEIPYEAKSKCRRGRSYYTNSMNAKDTDVNKGSELESLLSYYDMGLCFYCLCSVDGKTADCRHKKSLWYCEYYRYLKHPFASKDMYRTLFQQDRPTYFRQLSHRIRRTMEDGIFDLIKTGGDSLCCSHPDGHRRHLHNHVRNKVRQMKRKVPKENLLSGGPGGDYVDFVVNNDKFGNEVSGTNETHCIPFVSEYSDCSDANACTGCSKCTCTAEGKWTCEAVNYCPGTEEPDPSEDDEILDNAIQAIQYEFASKAKNEVKPTNNHPLVPGPSKFTDDVVLDVKRRIDDSIISLMARGKRSIKESKATKNNSTIQFYEAVDEINEDTLKNSSKSGTINIKKIDVRKQQISRRTAVADNNNSSLNINHNPKLYDTHIADNKLETNHSVEQFDALGHEKLHQISGNISVQIKNKDLSKLVVNELKSGTEYIGDTHAPVMSNITFKSENDTLTAMTFIAGNLLNKLWNMEKDSNGESIETEILKHEKIADLLELFREPLSLRQENFLKNALEHLSNAVNNKDVNNVSLCANIVEATRLLKETSKDIDNDVKSTEEDILRQDIDNNKNVEDHFKTATTEAVSKINNVLSLMKKFEGIQKTLGDLRTVNKSDIEKTEQIDPLTRDENSVLSVYGNVLEKITKLIMPDKNSKRFSNKIGNINLQEVKRKLKDSYNIDVGNTNMTAKDKLVVEYINHIENNPGCLLKDKRYNINAKPIPKVEGILLNLSEFFKIKSFTDLLKMLEPEKSNLRVTVDTTIKPVRTTTITTTESANIAADQKKFASTKEKLKAHLKIIVEDLIEMQNVSGLLSNGSDISLADVLPCIYNILNDISLKGNNPTELERITAIFKSIKEAMNMPETRRSSIVTEGRPKSVVVWERVINNLDKKQKLKTRRTFDTKLPKSYEELKKMMDRIESYGSNTYKNVPFFTEVPPADKLVLLKTLDADSKRYIKVLEDIKISMDTITDLSLQKRKDIDEFVENADRNIKLNEKVVKALNNKKINNLGVDGKKQLVKAKPKAKPSFKLSEAAPSLNTYETNNKMKVVTRDEIIQQLIKNRMLIYINMKETKGGETNDVNYEIAKKILMYLENGNYRIAREMYKFFVSRKQISSAETSDRFRVPTYGSENLSQSVQFQKQPLVQFEETKLNNQIKQVATQDHLLKQLLNIKNMSI